jgi:hypothetical protein
MGISVFPASGGGLQKYSQTFYKSGTWTKPAGVKQVSVTCIGGGGGAYSQDTQYAYGGGAGGYIKTDVDVTALSSASIVIAAGGTSTAAANFANVSDGGTTSFGDIVRAYGGQSISASWNHISQGFGSAAASSGRAENVQVKTNSFDKLDFLWLSRNLTTSSGAPAIHKINIQRSGPYKVAYGAGKFVSSNETNGSINYSSDGITWTKINPLDSARATRDIIYNGTNFVATAAGSRNTAYYSADGVTWTSTTLPSTNQWTGASTGNGITIVYDKDGATTASAVSTNGGTSWTAVTLPAFTYGNIIYANGYFYLKSGSSSDVHRSTDGVTWTSAGTMGSSWHMGTLSFYNNLYVSAEYNTEGGTGTTYYTSTNGTSWSARNWSSVLPGASTLLNNTNYYKSNVVLIKDAWYTVIYSQSAANGAQASGYIYKTTDGTNWTYVRSYWKGAQPSGSYVPTQGFGADVFELSPGRFYVPWSDYYGSGGNKWNTAMILLTDTFVGGQEGFQFSNSINDTGARYTSGASAFGSIGAVQPGTAAGNNSFAPGLGTPEGYCVGGRGNPAAAGISGDDYSFWNKAYIGCGADVGGQLTSVDIPVRNGGDGLVVVEWWA